MMGLRFQARISIGVLWCRFLLLFNFLLFIFCQNLLPNEVQGGFYFEKLQLYLVSLRWGYGECRLIMGCFYVYMIFSLVESYRCDSSWKYTEWSSSGYMSSSFQGVQMWMLALLEQLFLLVGGYLQHRESYIKVDRNINIAKHHCTVPLEPICNARNYCVPSNQSVNACHILRQTPEPESTLYMQQPSRNIWPASALMPNILRSVDGMDAPRC